MWVQQPVVEVRDGYENVVVKTPASVTLTMTSGDGQLQGTVIARARGGVATFTDLKMNVVGPKVLTAVSSGLTSAVSAGFTIVPGEGKQFVFSTQPIGGAAGASWSQQPVIQVLDSEGNLATSFTDPVSVSISSGSGTVAGTATLSAVAGVATFTGLSTTSSGDKIITVSSGGLTTANSSTFTITPASAAQLAFATQPGGGTAGQGWSQQPTVQVLDIYGNVVTSSSASISMALSTGTGGLSGTTSVSASSGLATFSGLSVQLAGLKKVTASSAGLTSAVSNSFTIVAATAAQLAFSLQPGGGVAGQAWSQQPRVEVQDSFGNLVSSATHSVSLTISSGTGALSGTSTQAAVAGSALFSALSIDLVGTKFLTATAAGLTSATSSSFSITPASGVTLGFSVQPGGGAAGQSWSQQPQISVYDSFGNLATSATPTISLALYSGTGSLIGTTSLTAVSGVSTFTGIKMNAAGAKRLVATAASLTTATSSTFNISAGTAVASSSVVASATSLLADGSSTTQITVSLVDAYANPVTGTSVTLSSSRGASDTISTSPSATDSGGIVVFLVKSSTSGTSNLTAAVPSASVTMTTTPSISFESILTNVATSAWSVNSVSQAANGSSTSTINVTIRNASGSGLPGKAVTLVSARGASDQITGSPATTDATGAASFTISSATSGDASLTIAVTTDSVTLTNLAKVLFLDVAPFADYQPRFASSSSSAMNPGSNVPPSSDFTDLFNLGPNNGTLFNFNFNGSTSGWATAPDRLILDGANDYVTVGTGLNSQASQTQEIWIKPTSPATKGKIFLSNGDDASHGFTMRQAWDGTSKAEVTIGNALSYPGEVLADSPAGYWRLNETSGTSAAAVNGSAGTYTGTYTLNLGTGVADNGSSVKFDGSTAYVSFGNVFEGTNDFTAEAWIFTTTTANTHTIVSKQSATRGYALDITTGKPRFTVINSAGTSFSATSSTVLITSKWYHVAGVRDSAAGLIRLYVNGVEEANTAITGTLGTSNNNFYIGNNQGFGSRFWTGRIDEVAIYNTALSQSRIIAHSDAGARPTCYSTTTLTNANWFQVAATFDGTSRDFNLYVNGSNQCTKASTGLDLTGSTWPLAIGASVNASSSVLSSTIWRGQVGDLRIFDSVLTAGQVSNNYSAASGRFP